MHLKITLIFITILFIACQNNEKTSEKNNWISANMEFWSEPGIYIDLTNTDTLYLAQNFDFKNLESHGYTIDSLDNLILDDSIKYGTILKRTKQILMIKDSLRTQAFMPVRDYQLDWDTTSLKRLLLSNDWILNESWNPLRIDFTNEAFFNNNAPKLKLYFRITEKKGWELFEFEWWSIEKIDKSLFLVLSIGQMNYQVYQIKEIYDSLILTETIWSDSVEDIQFLAQKKLAENKYIEMNNSIIGTWQLIDYKEQVDSSQLLIGFEEELVPLTGERNRPYHPEDSVPILFDTYFNEKELRYIFTNEGRCLLKKDNTILRNGEWRLSKDGKYIKIQNNWMPSMKIISFSDSIMITGKHETIEFEKSDGWKDKYIIEKLKKVE